MAPNSLCDMCTRVCLRYIHEVTSVGPLPPENEFVRRILLKVDNAAQLRMIEESSPQLGGELEEYWRRLIKKDFPTASRQKNYIPRTADKWYKVYRKYGKEREIERAEALSTLQQTFNGIEQEKQRHLSKLVDKKEQRLLPKPPRTGRNLGAKRSGKDLPSSLTFGAGSRMKMTTGRSVMKRARREAREIASITSRLSTPSGVMPLRATQIKKAPQAMVNDHRIAAQPALPRIRAAQGGGQQIMRATPVKKVVASGGNYISDSGSEDEEPNPLFDDEEPEPPPMKTDTTLSSLPPRAITAAKKPGLVSNSKKGGGLLSNAYRPETKNLIRTGAASKLIEPKKRTADLTPDPGLGSARSPKQPGETSKSAGKASSPNISPPLRPADSASSPPPRGPGGIGQDPMLPRKRKAVDVFMRPMKRK